MKQYRQHKTILWKQPLADVIISPQWLSTQAYLAKQRFAIFTVQAQVELF